MGVAVGVGMGVTVGGGGNGVSGTSMYVGVGIGVGLPTTLVGSDGTVVVGVAKGDLSTPPMTSVVAAGVARGDCAELILSATLSDCLTFSPFSGKANGDLPQAVKKRIIEMIMTCNKNLITRPPYT
jgi:hypothetical protein